MRILAPVLLAVLTACASSTYARHTNDFAAPFTVSLPAGWISITCGAYELSDSRPLMDNFVPESDCRNDAKRLHEVLHFCVAPGGATADTRCEVARIGGWRHPVRVMQSATRLCRGDTANVATYRESINGTPWVAFTVDTNRFGDQYFAAYARRTVEPESAGAVRAVLSLCPTNAVQF